MKGKYFVIPFLVAVLLLSGTMSFADGNSKGKHGDKSWFESKILKKAGFALKNKDELGLTDEQYKKIKKIKYATKKEIIKSNAEVDLLVVDIKMQLWEEKINVPAIDKLIDQKYEIKKAKAKKLVQAYADLKSSLTEEQTEKLGDICRKGKTK